MKTKIAIKGINFQINDFLTYEEITGSRKSSHGLLMNARFIQGIFNEKSDPDRFARFGFDVWDPEAQTDRLIAALPLWYTFGLRAFTVGLQGGGPCFTTDNSTVDNNPFGSTGDSLDSAYKKRLDRLIRAADAIGMIVIVSFFYGTQAARIADESGIKEAVCIASRFLKESNYTNVIIEVANEMDLDCYNPHNIIRKPEGMVELLNLARKESGGMICGCSGSGGYYNKSVAEASDVVIIHGNGCTRQRYFQMIKKIKEWCPDKPVICNEDSQAIGQMLVSDKTHTSWGYYNNMTKQEPPTDWTIQKGEDHFFALRMAQLIGIQVEEPEFEDQYVLMGMEPHMHAGGQRWIRLASLYPETINYVDFYKNGVFYDTCFDESFSVHFDSNWLQGGVDWKEGDVWKAKIYLRDGKILEKESK